MNGTKVELTWLGKPQAFHGQIPLFEDKEP
jgi:hypothetical protein